MITVGGFDISSSFAVLGVLVGLNYGLLAVGLVLVYRANRVINLAHGQLGAFGGALAGIAAVSWHVPYWLAFLLGLATSAAAGMLAELAVVRRLHAAPKVTSLVATLGVAALLATLTGILNGQAPAGSAFPQPTWLPSFDIGSLVLTPADVAELILAPVLVIGLAAFLRRSRYGLAMRAAAANPAAARMAGISTGSVSTIAWALAGGLAAFSATLVLPAQGFIQENTFGPDLLLKALAAAVAARLTSLPVALAAGIAIGVLEQELLYNDPRGDTVQLVLFLFVLAMLLTQRRRLFREREGGAWAASRAWQALPESYRRLRSIRLLRPVTVLVLLGGAAAFPFLISQANAQIAATILAIGLVAVSVGIVTGLSGQLSLGQFAFAGIGAAGYYIVSVHTNSDLLALVGAGLYAAVAATLVGLPALRIRGLMLAVTTLAFALAQSWLLARPWLLGSGRTLPTPALGAFAFSTGRRYYFWALAVFAVSLWLVSNLRRSGFGRTLIALRDNEAAARAFTVPATLRTLQAFAVAGFFAGIGGGLLAGAYVEFGAGNFSVDLSTNVAVSAVLGGLGVLIGPLLGVLYIFGIPAFVPFGSAAQAGSALGWLFFVLYVPGGIGALAQFARDRAADRLARRAGLDPVAERSVPAVPAAALTSALRTAPRAAPPGPARPNTDVILSAARLAKSFGGVHAVADVSLQVRRGETLALIGPNGAGKTTLFELLGGFLRPDRGRVLVEGRDVTRLSVERRARLGLIRSFQDAALFPNSTVWDAVRVAGERRRPSHLAACLVAAPRSERQRAADARRVLALLGLQAWQDRMIGDLSTGVRRITELACVIALEPRILLLDEPSAGIAQRETEALAQLLAHLRAELALTLVVVEHDIPFVTGLADRMVVMAGGRIVASGEPESTLREPAVVESYLGYDPRAIGRSDVAPARQA